LHTPRSPAFRPDSEGETFAPRFQAISRRCVLDHLRVAGVAAAEPRQLPQLEPGRERGYCGRTSPREAGVSRSDSRPKARVLVSGSLDEALEWDKGKETGSGRGSP